MFQFQIAQTENTPLIIVTAFFLLVCMLLLFLWRRAANGAALISAETGKQLADKDQLYAMANSQSAALSDELESVRADNKQLVADVETNAQAARTWQHSAKRANEAIEQLAPRAVTFRPGQRVTWKNGRYTHTGTICAMFPPGADVIPPDEFEGVAVTLRGTVAKRHDTLPVVLVAVKNGAGVDVYRPLLTTLKFAS